MFRKIFRGMGGSEVLRNPISETSKLKKSWTLFKFNGLCEMNILLKFGIDLQSSIWENQYQKWVLIHGFLWEYLGETQNTYRMRLF